MYRSKKDRRNAPAPLRDEEYLIKDEDVARLLPFGHEHIDVLGCIPLLCLTQEARDEKELRPLQSPMEPLSQWAVLLFPEPYKASHCVAGVGLVVQTKQKGSQQN